jgi:hypothetical protein
MQDPLGDARLRGYCPAGEAGDAVSDQHPHGGVEELLVWVLQRYAGRQRVSLPD